MKIRPVVFLISLFLIGICVFFVYEKIKSPNLTIVKKEEEKSQERLIAEIRGLMKRLSENPNDEATLEKLGDLFSSLGQWEKALFFFNRLEKKREKDPKVKEKIAMCYFYMREYVLAYRKLKEVLKLDPDNVFVHFNIGLLYSYFFKDKKKAKEHFLFVINSKNGNDKLKSLAKEEINRLNNKSLE